jgi:thiamine biosynthesis lipoprotein
MQPGTSVSFQALGTTAVVAVTEPAELDRARGAVEQVIEAFDRACSRFRADSEVHRLSDGSADRVSDLLFDAVTAALRAPRRTDGGVDPTVGVAHVALGYDRDFSEVASGVALAAPVQIASVPGWQVVIVDERERTVRVPRGVELDLGATAKALAADHAAEAARQATRAGVLVSLGGDLAVAGPVPEDGWRVRVTDDHRAGVDAPGQWIAVRSGGLATSSTAVRRWETDSGIVHHLIDPRSGKPVDGCWRTVSVCAGSCLDANIVSTAAIVRGERAVEWLQSLGLPSRLVSVDGGVRHIAGWPSAGDDLA